MRLPLFWKILLLTLLPLVAFSILGFVTNYLAHRAHSIAKRAHYLANQELEDELGRRLTAIARTTGALIPAGDVGLIVPGDEGSRAYRNVRRKLAGVVKRAEVRRVYLFDPNLRSLCDTKPGVAIGARYYQLEVERPLIERVFQGGGGASILFKDKKDVPYKTGFAPLRDDRGRVVAALAVESSTAAFQHHERLSGQLKSLSGGLIPGFWVGAIVLASLLLLVGASLLIARSVTRPVKRLMGVTDRIGAGDLEQPIEASSGDELGVLAGAMDRMRRDLLDRQREMNMMLSGIAHEVRNPLGGMELFTGLLREAVGEDEEKLEMVQRIQRELDHLRRVVSEFLDYARQSPPELMELDLGDLMRDATDVVRGEADQAGVTLVANANQTPHLVMGDLEALRRALLNVLHNAIQATPSGGQVTLDLLADGDGVAVRCRDTGRGMEPEELDKIFGAFYTTKERGTGLGLAFTQRIVEAHGGRVKVESKVGEGTTLTLILPEVQTA